MNCKPGDLAYVARGRNYGVLVNVGPAWKSGRKGGRFNGINIINERGVAAWVCRVVGRPLVDTFAGKELHWYERPVADRDLRPIRDPGDDAVDETLLWLPSPSHTKETA